MPSQVRIKPGHMRTKPVSATGCLLYTAIRLRARKGRKTIMVRPPPKRLENTIQQLGFKGVLNALSHVRYLTRQSTFIQKRIWQHSWRQAKCLGATLGTTVVNQYVNEISQNERRGQAECLGPQDAGSKGAPKNGEGSQEPIRAAS